MILMIDIVSFNNCTQLFSVTEECTALTLLISSLQVVGLMGLECPIYTWSRVNGYNIY